MRLLSRQHDLWLLIRSSLLQPIMLQVKQNFEGSPTTTISPDSATPSITTTWLSFTLVSKQILPKKESPSCFSPVIIIYLQDMDFRTAYQRLLRCRKVVPDARKIPLNQEMRDKTSNQTQCKLEDNSLQLHTMDEKGNSLVQDSLERNLNPARDKTSSAIVSCCQCFWLAKILPKRVVWIPVFEEPGANGQNTRQSSAQQRVIYCVVS
ncbi:histamine H2 receptor isoform X4 [Anolis carolinensis]|uniref:histamine H2 receptor isoform X4 n=1 Tax=Anolis carolinensis TaxID=28377 RepID=UPI002F2B7024